MSPPEVYTYKHANGEVTYKRGPSGVYYHLDTTPEMVHLLEELRAKKTRVRFHWGDVKTGKDWGDRYDVAGTLSNSMGPLKVPILIHSRRSMGGDAVLDNCIVKITETRAPHRVLYQHPTYHTEEA